MKMLTAHQFAGMEKYRFGIDDARTVKILRELADGIEGKSDGTRLILPQEVIVYSEAKREDYTLTTLVFVFAQKAFDLVEHESPDTQETLNAKAAP